MKKALLWLLSGLPLAGLTQTGPGGVGNSSSNLLWIDAAQTTGFNNGQAVSSAPDMSGNNNNASNATNAFRPLYHSTALNGRPGFSFDGTNDFLQLGSNITTSDITMISVATRNATASGYRALLVSNKHHMFARTDNGFWGGWYSTFLPANGYLTSSPTILSQNATSASTSVVFRQNGSQVTKVRGNFANKGQTLIGANPASPATMYHKGHIGEMIVFNTTLSQVQTIIVENYLGAKYQITIPNDFYAHQASYGSEVAGIGQSSNGSSHTDSKGSGIVRINSPSSLASNEYLFWGHDDIDEAFVDFNNHPFPNPDAARMARVWRADHTGDVGTVSISFDLNGLEFGDPADYSLLIDADGDFSSGATVHTGGYSYSTGVVTWTGVVLSDDVYFTVANTNSRVLSITTGDWNTTSTWNCNCVPLSTQSPTIVNGDVVSLITSNTVTDLTIEAGAELTITSTGSLTLLNNFVNNGTLSGDGGLTMNGSSATGISGTGSGEIGNLTINNSNGVTLSGSTLSVSNTLTVSAGNFNVGSGLFTLASNSTQTARIAPVIGSISGSMTIQRHISARSAGFSDFSSPVQSSTFQDWDNELLLEYTYSPPNAYPSAWSYDESLWDFVPVTSSSTSLTPGTGFEVYLDSDGQLITFNETVVNTIGSPNTGDVSTTVTFDNDGWNLIGNPYASHISWDDFRVDAGVPMNSQFMYYDASIQDYSLGNPGDEITPGAGFWIEAISAGVVTFTESMKTTSINSLFRNQASLNFTLRLSSEGLTRFTSNTQFDFNDQFTSAYEQGVDAVFRKVPHADAPSLYSVSPEGKNLRLSHLADEDRLSIPLEYKVGIEGFYTIAALELESAQNAGYTCVVLEDTKLGTFFDLSSGDYRFNASLGENGRFILHLSKDQSACNRNLASAAEGIEGLEITRTTEGVFVKYDLNGESASVIQVHNLLGQEIANSRQISVSKGNIRVNIPEGFSGIFIVSVQLGEKRISKKFFNP